MEIHNPKIMAIDVSRENLMVLKTFLADMLPGAKLLTGHNGPNRLEPIRAQDPDVILLDIDRQCDDRLLMCTQLKADMALNLIPVIFLSNRSADKITRRKVLEVGADGFLIKPIDGFEFIVQIRTMAKLKAASRPERLPNRSDITSGKNQALEPDQELSSMHKQLAENFSKSQTMLRRILDAVPQSIFWKNHDGKYLGCNAPFAEVAGVDIPEQIVGKTDDDLPWLPREADAFRAHDRQVIGENRPKMHIIEKMHRSGGKLIWVDTCKVPLLDSNGIPYGVLGIFDDITENRKIKKKLQESEDRFSKIFRTIPVPMSIARQSKAEYVEVNDAWCELTGFSREEAVGRTAADLKIISPRTRAKLQQIFLRTGRLKNIESEIRTKCGEERSILTFVETITIKDETFSINTILDLTERRQFEAALRESELRLSSSLDHMMEGCQIIGHDWRYLYLNAAAEQHSRRSKEELLGNRFMDMWSGVRETELFQVMKRCLKERVAINFENLFIYPDGQENWFELSIQPVPEGIFILSMDIRARKKAEAVLNANQEELEEKIRERTTDLRKIVNAMAGREIRMAELKEKIAVLQAQLQKTKHPFDATVGDSPYAGGEF